MNKLVEMYIKNKISEFIRKSIYKIEITKKGGTGVKKFQKLIDNLWDKAEEWIVEEKKQRHQISSKCNWRNNRGDNPWDSEVIKKRIRYKKISTRNIWRWKKRKSIIGAKNDTTN